MEPAGISAASVNGDLKGYWASRARNWRVIFKFADGEASDVIT